VSFDVMSSAQPLDFERLGVIGVVSFTPKFAAPASEPDQVAALDRHVDSPSRPKAVRVSCLRSRNRFTLCSGNSSLSFALSNLLPVPQGDPRTTFLWRLRLIPGTHVVGVLASLADPTGTRARASHGTRREIEHQKGSEAASFGCSGAAGTACRDSIEAETSCARSTRARGVVFGSAMNDAKKG
jgi:hypothetical protein